MRTGSDSKAEARLRALSARMAVCELLGRHHKQSNAIGEDRADEDRSADLALLPKDWPNVVVRRFGLLCVWLISRSASWRGLDRELFRVAAVREYRAMPRKLSTLATQTNAHDSNLYRAIGGTSICRLFAEDNAAGQG
jgi:hypothetical protein